MSSSPALFESIVPPSLELEHIDVQHYMDVVNSKIAARDAIKLKQAVAAKDAEEAVAKAVANVTALDAELRNADNAVEEARSKHTKSVEHFMRCDFIRWLRERDELTSRCYSRCL